MTEEYDKEKIIQLLFDPQISEILSELESGAKELSQLAQKFQITEDDVRQRLGYLIQYNFVKEETKKKKTIYQADANKLAKVLENDQNFKSVVDGLTEMDSYLN